MNGSPGESSDLNLETADYDAIEHLNALFPHPGAISSIGRVSQTLQSHQDGLSKEINGLEKTQAHQSDSSLERMQSAQTGLGQLFGKIETVQWRAMDTEQNITSMTADIKRLDGTKGNLTLSMTALKRLQMLTTAYEQLRVLAKTRQYRECAGLLQAVVQLMKHFNSYRSIEQIATLSREVSETQRELVEQICEDFELAFSKGEVGTRRSTLVEACLVMDALGETARARLASWYVNTELREYRQVFRGNDEAGSLDNIDRRYSWFKRRMKRHEEEHAAIFPTHWRVNEMLATSFCEGTRDDFRAILERSMRRSDGAKMDVDLLLRCLQETLDFELGLDKALSNGSRASIDTLSSTEGRQHSFNGVISVAFEPCLSLWVESQDRQLATMLRRYRQQPSPLGASEEEEFTAQAVMGSAIELFHFYKLTLSQCAKLSTGERLLDLSRTFARYLDEYAQQVLLRMLQGLGTGASGASGASAAAGNAVKAAILVLNTADFWYANTMQLEENIRKRIDADLAPRVEFAAQSDAFLGVASAAVLALVHVVEVGCEGSWREMRNMNWSGMDGAGDQSSYVTELVRVVNGRAEEVLGLVGKTQYARAFCDHLVDRLATAFIYNIVQCRPISEAGAQQMLVDKYALTKSVGGLLSHHNPSQPTPTSAFVRRAEQCMNKMDPLLKTLQVRSTPPEGLVQAYLIHIADRSDGNFRKILDLKGVRKQDQAHLVELFGIHRAAGEDQLAAASALLTPLALTASSSLAGGGGGVDIAGIVGIGGLGHYGTTSAAAALASPRLDAGSLGEKLLSAARDIGGATDRAGADKATINENLRSFGNFFKRDIGGLGVRFGMRDGAEG